MESVPCQVALGVAAARCGSQVWKAHTDCFSALLEGKSCAVTSVGNLVEHAHLDALSLIDLRCKSSDAQALGFTQKDEAETDMGNFCAAVEDALVSAVYGTVVSEDVVRQVDDRTRACVQVTASAATRLIRFAFGARRRALDQIAAIYWNPIHKQILVRRSSMLIEKLREHMQRTVDAVCPPADFAALYHQDAGALLDLIGQRADCLAGAVYVQGEILCPPPTCGNQMKEPGEACDDGNLVDGDGCSSGCMLETSAHVR